jgi:hypothetical protein
VAGQKEVVEGIASLLVGIATGCSQLEHGSSKPCLALLQLPEDATDGWYVTLPKARVAAKGHQRAAAGTSIARQFNFHANSPKALANSSQLLQMLQLDSVTNDVRPARRAAQAGQQGSHMMLYSIRSRDQHAVAYALARPTDGCAAAAASAGPGMLRTRDAGNAGNALWLDRLIKCSKKSHKLQGQEFDSFKWAYVSVGVSSGSSSRNRSREAVADLLIT